MEADDEDDDDDDEEEGEEDYDEDQEDGAQEYDGREHIVNEDSMDVGMMQQNSDSNVYSSFSNQGIF